MKLGPLLYLAIALALSLVASAFLGWQWAGAKAECRAGMERAAGIAIVAERERATKASEESAEIAADTHSDTMRALLPLIQGTQAREQDFRAVPVTGGCRMPDSPSLQPAIDAANAAGGQ